MTKSTDRVLRALEAAPRASRAALAERLEMPETTVHTAIGALRRAGRIYVSGWRRSLGTGGRWAALFSVGRGPDAAPPSPVTLDSKRRYHERNKALIYLRRAVRRGTANPWRQLAGPR